MKEKFNDFITYVLLVLAVMSIIFVLACIIDMYFSTIPGYRTYSGSITQYRGI